MDYKWHTDFFFIVTNMEILGVYFVKMFLLGVVESSLVQCLNVMLYLETHLVLSSL